MKVNALLFNMSLNEFWYGNPQDFYVYADAYEEKNKQQDYFCWLNGTYNLHAQRQALCEAFSKTAKQIYPKEPFYTKQEYATNGIARNKLQAKILAGLMKAQNILNSQNNTQGE